MENQRGILGNAFAGLYFSDSLLGHEYCNKYSGNHFGATVKLREYRHYIYYTAWEVLSDKEGE